MNKYMKYTGIGILILIAQVTLADWIRIVNVKPDFIMLYVVYLGYREGKSTGLIFGFLFGLIQDLGTASVFIGLSSLIKSIVGFGAGYLHGRFHTINPIVLYLSAVIILFVGHFLYFGIYYTDSPLGMGVIFNQYILPAFAYTTAIGSLVLLTVPVKTE